MSASEEHSQIIQYTRCAIMDIYLSTCLSIYRENAQEPQWRCSRDVHNVGLEREEEEKCLGRGNTWTKGWEHERRLRLVWLKQMWGGG